MSSIFLNRAGRLGSLLALASTAAFAQSPPPAPPFGVAPVSATDLGAITGQADIAQVVTAQNRSEVSRNSVSGNSVTGTIALGDSFQNMNGLSVLNANTGNNVAINSSMNVNIAIRP